MGAFSKGRPSTCCSAEVLIRVFCLFGLHSEDRVDLLTRAVSGAAADVSVPQCQLSSLETIANQVIDDMEDKESVPDR